MRNRASSPVTASAGSVTVSYQSVIGQLVAGSSCSVDVHVCSVANFGRLATRPESHLSITQTQSGI